MEKKWVNSSEAVHVSCPSFSKLRMRQNSMERSNSKKNTKIAHSEDAPSSRINVDAEHIISKIRRLATSKLLQHIKQIVLTNPIEQLPQYKEELEKLIKAFSEYVIDPSPLKAKVDKLIMDAASYNLKMQSCSEMTTSEVQIQRLTDNKTKLDRAFDVQAVDKCHYESLRETLASVENRREKLRREQERLEERIIKLRLSLSESGIKIDEHQIMVDRLLKQKVEILKIPVLDSKDAKALKKMKESLETQCKSFKDITLE